MQEIHFGVVQDIQNENALLMLIKRMNLSKNPAPSRQRQARLHLLLRCP